MRQIGNAYAAGTKRRLVISCISALVAIPLACCCLLLIGTALFPMLDKVSASGNQNNSLYVILGVGLVALVGLLAIALAAFLWVTWRRARTLDTVFTPLGLIGSTYMLNGRHYQGQIGGRGVDIYIYRGPSMEFHLKANTQTRLLTVAKGSLPTSVAWIFDKHPLATDNPSLNAFSFFALDETWTRNLLAEELAGNAIQTLMTVGANWAIFRRVEIQPGEVTLTLYRSRNTFGDSIDHNTAQAWLNALQSLAQAAESQPTPEITDKPENASSTQARQKRSNLLTYVIIAIVFGMPLCFLAIGGIAYLAVTLLK